MAGTSLAIDPLFPSQSRRLAHGKTNAFPKI
jgi:hypothetical protein